MRARRATTQSSLVAAEQFGHRLFVGYRTRPTRGHPLSVVSQCGLYFGLFEHLGWSTTFYRPEPPELRQRDDRGGLTTEVDHLVRFT